VVIKGNKYKLSDEFLKKLMDFSAGNIPPESFDRIINLFEGEISKHYFTFSSESNLLRIISNMFDKISFLLEIEKFPHYAEVLISIASNSNYLSDILVMNPEFLYWIVNPSSTEKKFDEKEFQKEVSDNLNLFKTLNSKVNSLRRIKRKEILRIGAKDILRKAEIEGITSELSSVARVITTELFSLCYNEVLLKYGIKNVKSNYCIVALGKLGGKELNYSSDIDLIIFYDKNSELTDKKNYHEILTEAVHLFIECASSITDKGFIYRVDFRLRPDGRTSALCRPIDEYFDYYEIRGEDWERQMLIKMGYVCGSITLYNKFTNYLQPFIYPSSFSISPTEQIKKLKNNIEKNLKDEENIKLIAGGLRDIEFSVQALQLIYGGKNKELRTGNTLEAIKKLCDAELLNEYEASIFESAYKLYRKIEHYLQLMNDSQTHTIPREGEILEKMSLFLGFENTLSFRKKVLEFRKNVKKIFNSIMGINNRQTKTSHIISLIKFENKSRAEKDILYLSEGIGLLGQKQFDKQSIKDFEAIEPYFEEYLSSSTYPDLVLQNFVRIIRPVIFPSIWYKEFLNKKFFHSFLHLCEFSQKSIDLFAEDDDLREFFITRNVFEKLNKKNITALSTKRMLLANSIHFSLKLINAMEASSLLSEFFRQKIKTVSDQFFIANSIKINFAIIAMGSLGSGEMTLTSDIDLIFIVENLEDFPNAQADFQKLLILLKKELSPIEVDCRLRPEGKNSILVWDINSYQKYVSQRARIWELQAFCKLDFIAGDKKIFYKLTASINRRIKKESLETIKKNIYEMRQKLVHGGSFSTFSFFNIKKSSGGLADIDFLVQFLILTHGFYLKLRAKGILKSLNFFTEHFEEKGNLYQLTENFIFLKTLIFSLQCLFNSSSSTLPNSTVKLNIITKFMGFNSVNELQKKLSLVISSTQNIFNNFLGM